MNAQTAKITPGTWHAECVGAGGNYSNPVDVYEVHNVHKRIAEHLSEGDAYLLSQAGNVYHETGLTPRQLADQRAELLRELKYAESWIVEAVNSGCNLPSKQTLFGIRAAIAKAGGAA